ncbi:MAG: hypothetical protein QXJ75_00085 [Candidatus Bathyarchaeia archaeon]
MYSSSLYLKNVKAGVPVKFYVYRTSTGRLGGMDLNIKSLEELTSFMESIRCDVMIIRPIREGDLWELRIYDEYEEAQGEVAQAV